MSLCGVIGEIDIEEKDGPLGIRGLRRCDVMDSLASYEHSRRFTPQSLALSKVLFFHPKKKAKRTR